MRIRDWSSDVCTSDLLGLFAYCSCCGTRNDIQIFEKKMADIRTTLGGGGFPSTAVRDAVDAFDTLARNYSRQLVALIPMTPARKTSWARASFHSFTAIEQMKPDFDIDVLKNVSANERRHAELMFHSRPIYTH